jgi:DNA (cytosine-5)-methyltransferase 1
MALTVGSLFSGVGGLDLGFERAGFRVAWQCEINPFARRVLAKHWPDVSCYEDIRTIGAANVAPVDVLIGGFPCQDISIAGKGAGISGDRSGLWKEYARLISKLRPRYAVMENVGALLHRGLDVVLGDLASCGYDAEWQMLPASAFGAPHRRDRIFIVAYPASEGLEGIVGEVFEGARTRPTYSSWWDTEPDVARVAVGLRDRIHRVTSLGNSVVPQVAQYVAECVSEHHRRTIERNTNNDSRPQAKDIHGLV